MKRSKTVSREVYDRCTKDRDCALLALGLVLTKTPDFQRVIADPQEKGSRYKVKAFGLTRADEGVVVVEFHRPGQTVAVDAYRTPDWIGGLGSMGGSPIQARFSEAAAQIRAMQAELLILARR